MSCPHPGTAACGCAGAIDAPRRRVIGIAAAGLVAPLATVTPPAWAAARGDRLAEEDGEGPPVPLRLADIKPGKPLLAFPIDPKTGKPRDETRLNKLVLVRLPEAEMTPATRERAAKLRSPIRALVTRPR